MNKKNNLKLVLLFILVVIINSDVLLTNLQSMDCGSPCTTSNFVGSTQGGTSLTVFGTGFDFQNWDNNKIFVGDIEAKITDGVVEDTSITFETTSSGSNNDKNNLPIKVRTYNGNTYSQSVLSGHSFSYKTYVTPYLSRVYPSRSFGDSTIKFWGVHQISQLGGSSSDVSERSEGDIIGIKVGSELCDRTTTNQQDITENAWRYISCQTSKTHQAGKVDVSEQVIPGFARKNTEMKLPSLSSEAAFEHVIHPQITSFEPNYGSTKGQTLYINGNNFSPSKDKITVSVDGVNCVISSSTSNYIQCKLEQKTTQSALLSTNTSSSQVDGYLGGAGWYYERYDISALPSKTIEAFFQDLNKASPLSVLNNTAGEVILESIIPNVDQIVYGQRMKGYFYAPKTGTYKFTAAHDDGFQLYISDVKGSAQRSANPTLSAGDHSQSYNIFEKYLSTGQGTEVNLSEGDYIYMEVYHINGGGPGYVSLNAQVPNTDNTLANQVYEVVQLLTEYSYDKQIIEWNITYDSSVADAGSSYKFQNKANSSWNCYLDKDASLSSFVSCLKTTKVYNGNLAGVSRTGYNADGNQETNASLVTKYVYRLSIDEIRSSKKDGNLLFVLAESIGFSKSFKVISEHSDNLGGTFQIQLQQNDSSWVSLQDSNGIAIQFNSNVGAGVIQNQFRSLTGYQKTQVFRQSKGKGKYRWVIQFKGVFGDVPDIQILNNSFTGGNNNPPPSIGVTVLRQYSSNILYEPIGSQMMFTNVPSAGVRITVNGIQSGCKGDCSYTFVSPSTGRLLQQGSSNQIVPQLSSISRSAQVLTLQMSNVGTYKLQDLSIKFGGQVCSVSGVLTNDIPVSPATFTCSIATHNDGSPKIIAGTHVVEIKAGIIDVVVDETQSALNIPLTVTSLSVTSGTNNGGTLVDLVGHGFPYLNTHPQISVTICSQKVKLSSISNTLIQFNIPPCPSSTSAQNLLVQLQTLSHNSLSYSYTASANSFYITSVSPNSASPVLKQKMTITGTGFGTDSSIVKAYLSNSTHNEVYQMKVLSITDTQIQVGLPGGLPGTYNVQLLKDGTGYSNDNGVPANIQFKYEVMITSITPSSGSQHGGTLITIDGKNFVDNTQQSMVFVGFQVNWLCRIQSITTSQIKCRTPPRHSNYNLGAYQQVVVSSKLIQQSVCINNSACLFAYEQTKTPAATIDPVSSIKIGQSLNVSSISQCQDTNNPTYNLSFYNIDTGKQYESAGVDITQASSQVIVPNVQAGNYLVSLSCGDFGYSPSIKTIIKGNTNFNANSTISTQGGYIKITGDGLPQSWPRTGWTIDLNGDQNSIKVISNAALTQLVLEVPKGTGSPKININDPSLSSRSVTVSYSGGSTAFTSVTPNAINPGTPTTIKLVPNDAKFNDPKIVKYFSSIDPSKVYQIPISDVSFDTQNVSFSANLNSGKYQFQVYFETFGWSLLSPVLTVSRSQNGGNYSFTQKTMSYAGGLFTLQAQGISQLSQIKVGGKIGKYVSGDSNSAKFMIPPLRTKQTITDFPDIDQKEVLKMNQFTVFSDGNGSNADKVFDQGTTGTYSTTNVESCFIGIDMGSQVLIHLSKIRFFPNAQWRNVYKYLKNGKFQGSNDNITYTDIQVLNSFVNMGWNSIPTSPSSAYRYLRFYHVYPSGSEKSYCQLAEIEFQGTVYSNIAITDSTSNLVDVIYMDGIAQTTMSNALQFRSDATPTITQARNANGQKYGHVFGNYNITLTGTNLAGTTPSVDIDGKSCVVQSFTTNIICTVAQRPQLPPTIYFQVHIDDRKAIIKEQFMYVLRFSDTRTWGIDVPPIDGDFVYIPKGMTLLIDQTTPKLLGITAQNSNIIFEDNGASGKAIQVHTGFITVISGNFEAGTQQTPYQGQLSFTMYGGYYGTQQPRIGNKGIVMMNGKFSMYGKPVDQTWTYLASTANIGDTSVTLNTTSHGWKAGDQIVIASTDFDYDHAQRRTITSCTGSTCNFVDKLKYKHLSVQQTYGSHTLNMKAQVGMITRNIKVRGDPSDSQSKNYGSHLMMAGRQSKGLIGHIGYTEFFDCGQPQIVGRYCTHFHMAGDVPKSFVRGIAVHDSMARILTIHGTHYLHVEKNVGYDVQGHNFFLQDGVQTNNIIEYNLAIKTIESNMMMQTDMSAASYWITNPNNKVRYNNAAGGNFYGFWYEIMHTPTGASVNPNICPTGQVLGEAHHNVAHSNLRFGLRIFDYAPRQYPCDAINEQFIVDEQGNITSQKINPSIKGTFSDFTIYKNGQIGLLAQRTGNLQFNNFVIADNKCGGMQFWKSNLAGDNFVVAKDSAIIGHSAAYTQANSVQILHGTSEYFFCKNPRNDRFYKGISTPRSDGLFVDSIQFHNFGSNMSLIWTCTQCSNPCVFINSARQSFWKNIAVSNITSTKKLFMVGHKKQILYDIDGSLVKNGNFFEAGDSNIPTINASAVMTSPTATITQGFNHIKNHPSCNAQTRSSTQWDNAAVCNSDVTVRRVMFGNLEKVKEFDKTFMKVYYLNSTYQSSIGTPTTLAQQPAASQYTDRIQSYLGSLQPGDRGRSYALPFVMGSTYNIWWHSGIDWKKVSIFTSKYIQSTQPGILFRFNHTQHRQLFDRKLSNGTILSPTLNTQITHANCKHGDLYHHNQSRHLYACVSGSERELNSSETITRLDYQAIYCRYHCPAPGQITCTTKDSYLWSDPSIWNNGTSIATTDNITILPCWHMTLDQSAELDNLTIMGIFSVPSSGSVTLKVQFMWIMPGGSFLVGASDDPYRLLTSGQQFNLQFIGNRNDFTYTINPQVTSSKYLVNSGTIKMYGQIPTTQVKLTQTAFKSNDTSNTTSITIDQDVTGWKAGDKLAISASFSDYNQSQVVTISTNGINGRIITFDQPLQFTHYGSASSLSTTQQNIDYRASVAHLSRKIKIKSGTDQGWGYRFLNYGGVVPAPTDDPSDPTKYNYVDTHMAGTVLIQGVQFADGGQYDTEKSSFQSLGVNSTSNTIKGSSFHNCKTYCMFIEKSQNYVIQNNVFHKGVQLIAKIQNSKKVSFKNNLMLYAQKRISIAFGTLVACFLNSKYQETLTIQNNVCQGSYGHGFAFPYVPSDKIVNKNDNTIKNNLAGSTQIGFLFSTSGTRKQGAADFQAYASKYCTMLHSPGTDQLHIQRFALTDCSDRAFNLRFGSGSVKKDSTATAKNGYINAISRPLCDYCYGANGIQCQQMQALRLLAITPNGQQLPDKFGTSYDVICKTQLFDAKAFLKNIHFENYWKNYTNAIQSNPSIYHSTLDASCGNNYLFRPHKIAHDMSGSHHFSQSKCQNCQMKNFDYAAIGRLDAPDPSKLGWFGGCGQMVCTGKRNYLIQDHDGQLSGTSSGGTFIPNNPQVAVPQGCTQIQPQSGVGHFCEGRHDFAILEYESTAADANTRNTWPVSLCKQHDTNETCKWTSLTNGYLQWQWDGVEPLNKRMNRFITIINTNATYNMTFESQPPHSLRFQFQQRNEAKNYDKDNWILVKLHYPRPQVIRVYSEPAGENQNKTVVSPLSEVKVTSSLAQQPDTMYNASRVGQCGRNIYYHNNYTTHFYINGDSNCMVHVQLENSVKLTTRFEMSINEFYNMNGTTVFLDRMAALLGITDTSRIKIVGVYQGSVQLIVIIYQKLKVAIKESENTDNRAELQAIYNQLNTAVNSGNFAQEMVDAGLGNILSASLDMNLLPLDEIIDGTSSSSSSQEEQQQASQTGLIVGIVVGVGVVLIVVVIAIAIYLKRRRAKISHEEQIPIQSSDDGDKPRKKEFMQQESVDDFSKNVGSNKKAEYF